MNISTSTNEDPKNYKLGQIYSSNKCKFKGLYFLSPLEMSKEEWKNILDNIKVKYKILSFIRHGEGIHNVAEKIHGKKLWESTLALSEEYLDPGLTELGLQQALDLRKNFNNNMPKPELIISSPLQRCLLTAENCLPSNYNDIKKIIIENFRERNGRHYCDKRHSLDFIEKNFPLWDLSYYKNRKNSNEDKLWTKDRETLLDLNNRANNLIEWLWKQKERNILLSGHCGIIRECYANLGQYKKLKNCELSSIIVIEK